MPIWLVSLATKYGIYVLIALAAFGLIFAGYEHIRANAKTEVYNELKAKDAVAFKQREDALNQTLAMIERKVAQIQINGAANEKIVNDLNRPGKLDTNVCLDPDSVQQLNSIGRKAVDPARAGKR